MAKLKYRLVIAAGVALAVYGVAFLISAHGLTDHRHTNPSPGDEQAGGGLALMGLGAFLIVSGLSSRDRDRQG